MGIQIETENYRVMVSNSEPYGSNEHVYFDRVLFGGFGGHRVTVDCIVNIGNEMFRNDTTIINLTEENEQEAIDHYTFLCFKEIARWILNAYPV